MFKSWSETQKLRLLESQPNILSVSYFVAEVWVMDQAVILNAIRDTGQTKFSGWQMNSMLLTQLLKLEVVIQGGAGNKRYMASTHFINQYRTGTASCCVLTTILNRSSDHLWICSMSFEDYPMTWVTLPSISASLLSHVGDHGSPSYIITRFFEQVCAPVLSVSCGQAI